MEIIQPKFVFNSSDASKFLPKDDSGNNLDDISKTQNITSCNQNRINLIKQTNGQFD
ncbi:1613_t:CDS:1, partial [Acaulospora morrowiae]